VGIRPDKNNKMRMVLRVKDDASKQWKEYEVREIGAVNLELSALTHYVHSNGNHMLKMQVA
jgi:hypothetical protein